MNAKEKILLIQLLLEDIRNNWNDSHKAENRAAKAKSLCEEVANEINDEEFNLLADFCDTYIKIGKRQNDWDGRFFRNTFPMGYEKMDKIHYLRHTYNNRSKDFKTIVKEYMVSPELIFNDWEIN